MKVIDSNDKNPGFHLKFFGKINTDFSLCYSAFAIIGCQFSGRN